jgi:two-component system chemotaxis response regulator CheB
MTDLCQPIRVLVAEDSVPMRELLVQLLDADGRFRVVATAGDGHEVADLAAQLRPDVIAMNMLLPRLDGVGATRRIMAEAPTPIVIISTASDGTPTELAVEALKAGAVTVLDKPLKPGDPRQTQAVQELLTAIRLMAEVKVVRRPASGPRKAPLRAGLLNAADRLSTSKRRPVVVVLAASTGGPQAIQTILQALGADLDVPVLVVQHMSPGFLGGMVGWLEATCPQVVRLAVHGDEPAGGTVYVAPEDHHLLVTRSGKLALTKAPAVGGFRPSANTLFESVAECYGAAALGAVLTGMGEDGAAGLAALRSAGGLTIAQDEASAVVYGMPRAAAVAGAAERVLPLEAIGSSVRKLLGLKFRPHSADSQTDW